MILFSIMQKFGTVATICIVFLLKNVESTNYTNKVYVNIIEDTPFRTNENVTKYFHRTCRDHENCKFENDNQKILHFECDLEVSFCQCQLSKSNLNPHQVYVHKSNTEHQCVMSGNGPCGESDGIKVECEIKMRCIEGRCRSPDWIPKNIPENNTCLDDVECEEGLICSIKNDGHDMGSCLKERENPRPEFVRQCQDDKNCVFQNDFTDDVSIAFKCVNYTNIDKNFCACLLSELRIENEKSIYNVSWDSNSGKCRTHINRPCGYSNGLMVSCIDDLTCKNGICRQSSSLNTLPVGSSCMDDLDCKPGLVCTKIMSSSEEFRRYVCSNVLQAYSSTKTSIISIIIFYVFCHLL